MRRLNLKRLVRLRFRVPRTRARRRAWALACAAVALATGAIALAHSGSLSRSATGVRAGAERVSPSRITLRGPGLHGEAALTQGAVLANGTRQLFAELRLEAEQTRTAAERAPVALAVVLDVSGSMSGEKIASARDAVAQLVERMRDDDRIAVVLYNHAAWTLVPLARVGDARIDAMARVRTLEASGGTNIPQGVSLGATVLAGAPATHVRRIVLVSDGLDGSGQPLAQISGAVRARASEGVTLSSLGVGTDYAEAYLTALADAGHGNYEFLASGAQLSRFLHRELEEGASTVADAVVADLALPRGWRLVRVYGAQSEPAAEHARVPIGALFAGERRKAVLELEVDAGAPGHAGALGVEVAYRTVDDGAQHVLGGQALRLRAVSTEEAVMASRDTSLHADAVAAAVDEQQRAAIEAWRSGQVDRAVALAQQNIGVLRDMSRAAPSAGLSDRIAEFESDARNFQATSAASQGGRAYGLQRNARRRARAEAF